MYSHIGVFYYVLGNIRPAFRSSLQAVQLVAIAKASDIHTYGCDSLLQPFVEKTNVLARVCPISVACDYCNVRTAHMYLRKSMAGLHYLTTIMLSGL